MHVSEIFHSLQGEGVLAGVPSVFVRLAGCPLRCRWCDTAHAWDFQTGTEYGLDALVEKAARRSCRHVVITGGEPMAGPDLGPRAGLVEFTHRVKDLDRHVTIETAGVAFIEDLATERLHLVEVTPDEQESTPDKVRTLVIPEGFTRQDHLRGSITPEREWWDVLHYDLTLQVFPDAKSLKGSNVNNPW